MQMEGTEGLTWSFICADFVMVLCGKKRSPREHSKKRKKKSNQDKSKNSSKQKSSTTEEILEIHSDLNRNEKDIVHIHDPTDQVVDVSVKMI